MTKNSDTVKVTNAGNSPIVFTGPHNGWAVPEDFYVDGNPLGVEPHWFDPKSELRRHEACDWGMQNLFNEIERQTSDICLVAAQYSRLLVDINRIPSLIVYEGSSETGEHIHGNMMLGDAEKQKRMDAYYTPYHETVDKVMQDTLKKFGAVIWIDMHSFTPVWQGEPRHVGIGTLKLEKTVLTNKAEAYLEREFKDMFVPDQPYDLAISPHREMNGGNLIAERNNLEYFGLEIRNDLLGTPAQIEIMAEKLVKLAKTLL